MFNLLTPRSFRARLVDARYVDAKSGKTITSTRCAPSRMTTTWLPAGRAHLRFDRRPFRQMDPATTTMMELFEYMIGNTDVSADTPQHPDGPDAARQVPGPL